MQGTQLDACLCACRAFMGYGGGSGQPANSTAGAYQGMQGQPAGSMTGSYQGMQGQPATGMAGGYQGWQGQPGYQGMQGQPAASMGGGYGQGMQAQQMASYLPAQGGPVQVGCVLTVSAASSGLLMREVMQHLRCILASLSTVLHLSTCKWLTVCSSSVMPHQPHLLQGVPVNGQYGPQPVSSAPAGYMLQQVGARAAACPPALLHTCTATCALLDLPVLSW